MTASTLAAVLARIESGTDGLGVRAHDAEPDVPTYPYAVVHMDGGVGVSERESGDLSMRDIGWQTTVVGVTAAQCRAALDRVTAALEGWRVDPADLSCPPVQHPSSQPVRLDTEVPDRSLFIATDQWRVAR